MIIIIIRRALEAPNAARTTLCAMTVPKGEGEDQSSSNDDGNDSNDSTNDNDGDSNSPRHSSHYVELGR